MAYRQVDIGVEICSGCGNRVPRETEMCDRCGAPIDTAKFAELELKLKPALRSARRSLALVTAFAAIGLLAALARAQYLPERSHPMPHAMDEVAGAALMLVVLGACTALAFRRPYAGALIGLCVYAAAQFSTVIAEPVNLFPGLGLVIRIAILGSLIRGVRAGYRARDLMRRARRYDRQVLVGALALALLVGVGLGLAAHAAPDAEATESDV